MLLQLRDPLVLVLLAAAVLTVATGDWADAAIIALVVVVNTTLLDLLVVCAAATVGYAAVRLDRVAHPTKPPLQAATPAGKKP